MEIIIVLLPLALALGAGFVGFFIWAVKKGQYDDLETPKYRMLIDNQDELVKKRKTL
jgi:cbb3-type cytochrome oxidase maturation protein